MSMRKLVLSLLCIALPLVSSLTWAGQITGYPAASALGGDEVYPCDQDGVTKKCPVGTLPNVIPLSSYTSTDLCATTTGVIDQIGSTVTTLVVNVAATCTATKTVPSTLILQFTGQGVITVSTTKTLTIESDIVAPSRQIFSLSGTGLVNVTSGQPLMTTWYSSDLTVAVAAIHSAAGDGADGVPVHIHIPSGVHTPSDVVVFGRHLLTVTCDGGAHIKVANGKVGLFWDGAQTAALYMHSNVIDCKGRITSLNSQQSSDLVKFYGVLDTTAFFNQIYNGGGNGITIQGGFGVDLRVNNNTNHLGFCLATDSVGGTVSVGISKYAGVFERCNLGGVKIERSSNLELSGIIEAITEDVPALLLDSVRNFLISGIHFEGNTGSDIKTAATYFDNFGIIVDCPTVFSTAKTGSHYNIEVVNATTRSFELRCAGGGVYNAKFLYVGTTSSGAIPMYFVVGNGVGRESGPLMIPATAYTDNSERGIIWEQPIVGFVTWNPGDLASGSGETSSDVTVTGAVTTKGWRVEVGAPYDLQGLSCTGYISAADTAKIRCENLTGGNVNLASGSWRVVVRRD